MDMDMDLNTCNRRQGATKAEGGGRRAEGGEKITKSPNHQITKSLSPLPSPLSLRGFTLVELLVVIVIISMLVGLLMPALIAARGRARIAQCTNNQHELALAIQQYDVAKRHLPGYVNQVHGAQESWVPVLFPYLGRMDLWEGPNGDDGWRSGNPSPDVQNTYINQLVCPDDPSPSATCPLTYVVNAGVYREPPTSTSSNYPAGIVESDGDPTSPSPRGWGVFRDYYNAPVAPEPTPPVISLSDVRSPTRTVMLSEMAWPTGRQWNNTSGPFEFSWPDDPAIPPPVLQPTPAHQEVLRITSIGTSTVSGGVTYPPPLPPIHPGIVIVTFCDGHTESLSDDTLCNAYLAAP